MPQHKLETLLINREQARPPRDPVKWGHGTQGDPEQALSIDDYALDTLLGAQSGEDPIHLQEFPPTPENKTLITALQGKPLSVTQALFDMLRSNKDFQKQALEDVNSQDKPYERKYFNPQDK